MEHAGIMMKRRRISLCRHEIPGTRAHFDLFLGPEGAVDPESAVLRTWRLTEDPTEHGPAEWIDITPLDDHRGAYLELQGPTEPRSARGLVTPVRAGCCTAKEVADRSLVLEVEWDDGSRDQLEINVNRIRRINHRPGEHAPSTEGATE